MSYRKDVEDRMENPNLLKGLGINQKRKDSVKISQKRCEHSMQPMFAAHNDTYRGLRCAKCGYAEWA